MINKQTCLEFQRQTNTKNSKQTAPQEGTAGELSF